MVDGWWLMVDGWWWMVDGWWLTVDNWLMINSPGLCPGRVRSPTFDFIRNGAAISTMSSKTNNFLEMDSEMTDSRKRIQKWTHPWTAFVVSCSDCCFLFRKPRTRWGAVREPRALEIVRRLRLGGYPFVEAMFRTLSSNKIAILDEDGSPNELKLKTFGNYFWENVQMISWPSLSQLLITKIHRNLLS